MGSVYAIATNCVKAASNTPAASCCPRTHRESSIKLEPSRTCRSAKLALCAKLSEAPVRQFSRDEFSARHRRLTSLPHHDSLPQLEKVLAPQAFNQTPGPELVNRLLACGPAVVDAVVGPETAAEPANSDVIRTFAGRLAAVGIVAFWPAPFPGSPPAVLAGAKNRAGLRRFFWRPRQDGYH